MCERTNHNLTVQDFRKKCLPELTKIQLAWPQFKDATERGWLILHPTPAQISPGRQPNACA